MAKGKDAGVKLTEKDLAKLENRIGRVYAGAKGDIEKIIAEYWADFKAKDEKMAQKLDAGEIDHDYYKKWRLNHIGRGKRYEQMRDNLAERIYKANEVANSYINDSTPTIYSLNWNYSAYTIDAIHKNADLTLYDEQTVKRLIKEEPNLMPHYPKERALAKGYDLEYSKKVITNTITRSVLTGRTLKQMSEELQRSILGMGLTSSLRAARTSYTSAQNGGRLACMESAKARGIDVQKQWLTARDNRVRDSHLDINAEIKPINKPFGNGLMYPADRDGPPREVYNCRCTLLYVVDGMSVLDPQFNTGDTKNFEEWMQKKAQPLQKPLTPSKTIPKPIKKPKPLTIGGKFAQKSPKPIAKAYRKAVNYKKLTVDEFTKMAHKISKEERKILYGRSHFSGYINSSNARELNELMRYGKPLDAEFEKIRDTLENVIKRSTINENVMAIRYVDDGKEMINNLFGLDIPQPTLKFKGEEYKNAVNDILKTFKKGKIYQSNGFTSVSFVKDKNVMSGKGIQMNIKVPKGTKGYITTNKRESEVILPPNTKIRIDKVVFDTDSIPWKYIVDCTVVG
jgi:hypothetical protein